MGKYNVVNFLGQVKLCSNPYAFIFQEGMGPYPDHRVRQQMLAGFNLYLEICGTLSSNQMNTDTLMKTINRRLPVVKGHFVSACQTLSLADLSPKALTFGSRQQ